MIVLTEAQKNKFNEFKSEFVEILNSRQVDAVPIEIKSNLYILPELILTDDNFQELWPILIMFEKREVKSDEFIQWKI